MYNAAMRSSLAIVVGMAALLGAGCSFILEPIEQRYLFRPRSVDPALLALVASSDKGIEEVRLKTPDGVMLHGWLKRPTQARSGERFPLVVVFGGVRRETSWLIDRGSKPERWGWLFVNYRGFGLSEGVASESVVLEDARLIFDYAAARPDVDRSNIVVFGRSLGTYFTVALAKTRQIRGAILATPFDSFTALSSDLYPWLPVSFLLDGRYDAAALAPSVKIPALFIFAERDDVTPVERGAALAAQWGGPQRSVILPSARHYGIERREDFWLAVGEFLGELEDKSPQRNVQAADAVLRLDP
jgi:pimeloyl-ACP methyl ester carboxylesterase